MANNTVVTCPPVQIANSELRMFHSSIIEQDYLIKVRLPEKYSSTDHPYPVLYMPDGDHAFGLVTDIVQYLIYGQQVPDLIVVSTAYGSKERPEAGGANWRDRDLYPFAQSETNVPTGGAQFLRFWEEELIPYAESVYRIDAADRTLLGFSSGAVFVLYALFQKPGLFKRYIAVDGFDEHLYALERAYAAENTALPVRLSMASVATDDTSEEHERLSDAIKSIDKACDMSKFIEVLRNTHYSGLELEVAQLSSLGHFAHAGEAFAKGLVRAFRS